MIKAGIPAVKVHMAAMKYAQSRGLPFFFWQEQLIALNLYKEFAKVNN